MKNENTEPHIRPFRKFCRSSRVNNMCMERTSFISYYSYRVDMFHIIHAQRAVVKHFFEKIEKPDKQQNTRAQCPGYGCR